MAGREIWDVPSLVAMAKNLSKFDQAQILQSFAFSTAPRMDQTTLGLINRGGELDLSLVEAVPAQNDL